MPVHLRGVQRLSVRVRVGQRLRELHEPETHITAVAVRPKENLRVCYMVFSVSQTIRPRERGKLWAEEFLKRCGISKSYYDKHRSDVCGKGTTEENREYRKSVDKAIENARRFRNTP